METLLKIIQHTTGDRMMQDHIWQIYSKLQHIYQETYEQHR